MRKTLPVLQTPTPEGNGSSEIELPPLHEGALSWEELDCVLADLDDFAVVQDIAGRNALGEESKIADIVTARDLFVAGDLHGLQIHYEFADKLWVDTLLRESSGARLVRMPEFDHSQAVAEKSPH